jgi:hypothetical protein
MMPRRPPPSLPTTTAVGLAVAQNTRQTVAQSRTAFSTLTADAQGWEWGNGEVRKRARQQGGRWKWCWLQVRCLTRCCCPPGKASRIKMMKLHSTAGQAQALGYVGMKGALLRCLQKLPIGQMPAL